MGTYGLCEVCEKHVNSCVCPEPEQQEATEDIEWAIDETTNAEYVAMAASAIAAMHELDTMTEADTKRKKRIIRKSIRIIEKCIDETHSILFDKDEEE